MVNTETIQTVNLTAGAIALTIFALLALPEHGISNWDELVSGTKPDQLNLSPSESNPSGLTLQALLLGYPVIGIWYRARSDIVRAYLGPDPPCAKVGPLFAAFNKILPLFILFCLVSWAMYLSRMSSSIPMNFPSVNHQFLPIGLKGLMAAALLAALMSTIAAALNSAGTLVSIDM